MTIKEWRVQVKIKSEESVLQMIKWEVRGKIEGKGSYINSVQNRVLCCVGAFHQCSKNFLIVTFL